MLERIDALEQRVRELQAKVTELVDSVREMMEARAKVLLPEQQEPPSDSSARRK